MGSCSLRKGAFCLLHPFIYFGAMYICCWGVFVQSLLRSFCFLDPYKDLLILLFTFVGYQSVLKILLFTNTKTTKGRKPQYLLMSSCNQGFFSAPAFPPFFSNTPRYWQPFEKEFRNPFKRLCRLCIFCWAETRRDWSRSCGMLKVFNQKLFSSCVQVVTRSPKSCQLYEA